MDNRQEKIRLLALDLDGTLFNTEGKITTASVQAICRAQERVCMWFWHQEETMMACRGSS